ncbi:T9SS type A sorting domain-containing protein [Chryseobacterium camelliae]|uniref:T9SS type A sorting domain-containing protein n=1 Tax=Chryseobacterium camelliae TaxID=1265445 RepID=A0ABY7QN14_9FLAO|nr:T9SS type A sorting domain-containing protein [Chryseobacterium camelliae]WBV61040.1 T9SS type A sorting domain-containing protein [Chryseobacterium camelliae]
MKKILFFVSALFSTSFIFGQVIDNQNFNSLTIGNVGTNTTGTATGQGGYYLVNGTVSDYQISAIDAAHGNSLKVTAGPGYVATSDPNNHSVVKLVGVNATAGNNIIKATFSFYTGSANGIGSIYFTMIDDGTTPAVIAGLVYNVATKTISAAGARLNNGTRQFALFKILNGTYPANTWVSVGVAYNMTTGASTFYTPQETYSYDAPASPYALIPGLDIGQYRTYNFNATGNTVAYDWAIDDVNVSYSNNTVLAANEVANVKSDAVTIHPNPTSDILNIKTDSKITAISVVDLTGRKVNVKLDGDKVDVRNLSAGNYLIHIETKEGIFTEKFIKK